MKPIKLVLSAYGPFPSTIEIDFEKLGKEGVFLVSGATGSGKTTIFDGIVYALYGTASGNLRTPGMMRSTYAKPSTKTFAEFTFKSNGRVYRIYRKPEQLVEKQRGEGFTTSPYEVSLEVVGEDIPPYTKKREVDEQIRNIIGLDANQFRQVTMIAQGEFLKVLNSITEERIAIFSKVFKTGKYRAVQEELKGEVKKRNESVNQMEDRLSDAFSKMIKKVKSQRDSFTEHLKGGIHDEPIVGMPTEDSLTTDISSALSMEEQKNFIAKLHREDNEKLNALEIRQSETKKVNAASISERTKLEQITGQFEELKKSREEIEVIERKKKELSEKVLTVPDRKGEIEKLKKQITSLEVERPRYQAITMQRAELTDRAKSLKSLKSSIDTLFEDIGILTKNSEIKSKELKKLEEKVSIKTEVAGKITQVESLLRSTEDFLDNYEIWDSSKKDCSIETDDFLKKDSDYKEWQKIVIDMESNYLKQQAGILAKDLEDGKPCPVCGSFHHPNPASIVGREILKEDIDDAKGKSSSLEKQRNEAYRRVSNLKAKVEASHNQAVKAIEKLNLDIASFSRKSTGNASSGNVHNDNVEDSTLNFENNIENLILKTKGFEASNKFDLKQIKIEEYKSFKENLGVLLKKTKEDFDEIEQAEESVKNLRKEIQDFEEQKGELQREYQGKKDKYNQLVGEYNSSSETLKSTLESMEFKGLEELEVRIKELISEKDKLSEEVDEILKEVDLLEKEWNRAQGQYLTIQKLTEDKDEDAIKENLERLSREISESENRIHQIEKEIRLLNSIVEDERETLKEYDDVLPKLKEAKKIRDIYANLSATCNGDLTGKEKIQLETFVQIAFLDSILVRANSRLLKMTNGRYKLVRQKTPMNRRSQTGLDLDVHDLSNDTYRSTKSLSGGESFQASLCLALGLADEIQSSSGGIAIETMFIDEGFGTLDSTALKNAVNNLIDLSKGNKMIGIISHVDYIYQRIPKRIVVEKQIEGGSTVNIQIDS